MSEYNHRPFEYQHHGCGNVTASDGYPLPYYDSVGGVCCICPPNTIFIKPCIKGIPNSTVCVSKAMLTINETVINVNSPPIPVIVVVGMLLFMFGGISCLACFFPDRFTHFRNWIIDIWPCLHQSPPEESWTELLGDGILEGGIDQELPNKRNNACGNFIVNIDPPEEDRDDDGNDNGGENDGNGDHDNGESDAGDEDDIDFLVDSRKGLLPRKKTTNL